MKLSVPIYRLRREARSLSRTRGIPLHEALDCIAASEGFVFRSLLVSRHRDAAPADKVLGRFRRGEQVLLAARPGQGKTQLGMELAQAAIETGRRSVFFTLECGPLDVIELIRGIGQDPAGFEGRLELDTSDSICSQTIEARLSAVPAGTLAVVDYLQLRDHKRANPPLERQVRDLRIFSRQRRDTLLLLSQIDRRFDISQRTCPGLDDVRLPNPLDPGLFDRTRFLGGGELRVTRAA